MAYPKKSPVALIVDDEKSICDTLSGILSDEGWESCAVYSGKDALTQYRKREFDLVLLDIWMPGLDGIEVLQRMKNVRENIPVVIMSGHGTIETAVKATKLGAYDFLEKPLSLEKLLALIERIEKGGRAISDDFSQVDSDLTLIGKSGVIRKIEQQIKLVAPRNSWVLITGENGTGKEVVARNIHQNSLRADHAFVAVNCAAIPEDLIESELFGHVKGAFTNALSSKKGRFEQANQGTLFLDEIADMSLKTQAKILRILQEQKFERLGDESTISVDVRVVAATNKDLQKEIQAGNFREDLYYRLNVIPIHMPALRERREDVPLFVQHFLRQISCEFGDCPIQFSDEAMNALEMYSWPGNVRELKNLIERVCIMHSGEVVGLKHLPPHLLSDEAACGEIVERGLSITAGATLKQARSDFERSYIVDRLEENQWNVSKTAESLGIERSHLHRKLRTYRIDPKRLRS